MFPFSHLMLGKTDRFAKISFLLFTRTDSKCEIIITDKRVTLRDKKGMPCEFQFVGKDKQICLLKKEPVG